MQAKWTHSGKTEVFIDTKAIPIIKKQVNPISQQQAFESRNLWKEVTAALLRQDVSAATSAKFTIEQKQRELVKERQEKGIKWENRVLIVYMFAKKSIELICVCVSGLPFIRR
jgi:hypothetical protein